MKVYDKEQRMHLRIFWVYGPIKFEERQEVWSLISNKGKDIDIPWVCIGDFNDIFYNYEKEWGKIRETRKNEMFQKIN